MLRGKNVSSTISEPYIMSTFEKTILTKFSFCLSCKFIFLYKQCNDNCQLWYGGRVFEKYHKHRNLIYHCKVCDTSSEMYFHNHQKLQNVTKRYEIVQIYFHEAFLMYSQFLSRTIRYITSNLCIVY